MKKNFIVTNEVYKKIVEEAARLPEMQRLVNGRPQYQVLGERVRTFVDDETNKRMKEVKRTPKPVLVNHVVEMTEIYRKRGIDGVNAYMAFTVQMAEAARKKPEPSIVTASTSQEKEEKHD